MFLDLSLINTWRVTLSKSNNLFWQSDTEFLTLVYKVIEMLPITGLRRKSEKTEPISLESIAHYFISLRVSVLLGESLPTTIQWFYSSAVAAVEKNSNKNKNGHIGCNILQLGIYRTFLQFRIIRRKLWIVPVLYWLP